MLTFLSLLIGLAITVSAVACTITTLPQPLASATFAFVTPHQQYSSSIGVLGCMIDTNRLAYWPSPPDYSDTMCIKNYLYIWESATRDPQYGGGFAATYINLPISDCRSLITTLNKKLPLSAANSMNYVASCLAQDTSWVANHYELWNIVTPACIYGVEEECVLDLAVSNQPTCPHQLDLQMPLTTLPVYDIEYGTGKKVLAI